MSEEIISPPYPPHGATDETIYNQLKELRRWVFKYKDELNESAGQDVIPAVAKIPDKVAFTSQPVEDKYRCVAVLRRVRCAWDQLVRSYEDAWDCKACVNARTMLVQIAAVHLNEVFVPFETREANASRDIDRFHRMFQHLTDNLFKLREPKDETEEEAT